MEPNKLTSKDGSPVRDFEIGRKNVYFDQGITVAYVSLWGGNFPIDDLEPV